MKEIKNVILCGLGAIGSIYAEKFIENIPQNFYVLSDSERQRRYKANPIKFNGKNLNVKYILPDSDIGWADLIIIATKNSGLADAICEIKNFVGKDTIILSLLNGVESEKIIANEFGKEKVLYSYFIGHSSVRENNTIMHDGVNTLVFGSDNVNDAENVIAVKNLFEKTGINYEIPEDIIHSLWLKFMLNVCANPITALLRKTFGQMLTNPKLMELAVKVMKEVQQIAKAEGVKNTETMIEETINQLKNMSSDGKTSMLQDVEAGRITERDVFLTTVVKLGEKHNIKTPYCKMLDELFEIIDYNK